MPGAETQIVITSATTNLASGATRAIIAALEDANGDLVRLLVREHAHDAGLGLPPTEHRASDAHQVAGAVDDQLGQRPRLQQAARGDGYLVESPEGIGVSALLRLRHALDHEAWSSSTAEISPGMSRGLVR